MCRLTGTSRGRLLLRLIVQFHPDKGRKSCAVRLALLTERHAEFVQHVLHWLVVFGSSLGDAREPQLLVVFEVLGLMRSSSETLRSASSTSL